MMYLYDIRLSRGCYIPPFLAFDDNQALEAVKEIVKTVPIIQKSYIRRIGEYDPCNGKLKSCKVKIVYKEQ